MFLDRASWLHRPIKLRLTAVDSCVCVLCVHLFELDGDLSVESNCVEYLDNEASGCGLPKNRAWQI